MSEGLKLLSSIIATESSGTLLRLSEELFIGEEVDAFNFMRDHFRQYRQLPQAATVRTETNAVLPTTREPLQFYIDAVTDRHSYNLMTDHYTELRQAMTTRNIAAMQETVHEMTLAMRGRAQNGVVVSMGEALGQVTDRLESTRGMGGMTGIPSGWDGMDVITGGFQNADLVTYVGRPSMGKTYQLLKQANHAHSMGHSPLLITTEMGIEQIGRRYVALELGIRPELLKMNMISSYMQRRIDALKATLLSDTRYKIFSVGMGTKVSAVEALMQEFGPSIVYLDGAYLLHPTAKGKMNRIERVGEVFDELKGLTISSNTPIVNTMQYNRQAGKDGKEGSLETIGFTDAVGMHSSIVLSLKHGPTENPRDSREMGFLKGREGESGSIFTNFRFAPVDFSEIDPEQLETMTGAAPDGDDSAVWTA